MTLIIDIIGYAMAGVIAAFITVKLLGWDKKK